MARIGLPAHRIPSRYLAAWCIVTFAMEAGGFGLYPSLPVPQAARHRFRLAGAWLRCSALDLNEEGRGDGVASNDQPGGDEHSRLLRWAEQQGTYVSPKVKLGFDPSGTRGWVATSPLVAGDLVLSAARSSVRLSASYVRAETETGMGAIIRKYQDDLLLRGEECAQTLSDEAVLALFVAAHRCRPSRAQETFFSPYIDALPDEAPLPLTLLRPADVAAEAADMRERMLESWRLCCAALAVSDKVPEQGLLKDVHISFGDFETAW